MKAFKFRIYPSETHISTLNEHLELCRQLYNTALSQRRDTYSIDGASITYTAQQNRLPCLKMALPSYGNVYSQVLQDVLRRVDSAFANFFRRVKERKRGSRVKAGFPRFKSADRYHSLTYPQNGFNIQGNSLYLSKIGNVRIRLHRPVEGTVKTCTIKRDGAGDWWAVFTSEIHNTQPVEISTAIGVDVGLIHLAVTSNGDAIRPPKALRKSMTKLKIEQKALSSKQQGSENRNKQRKRVARVHRRIERVRNDYLHKASRQIVDSADMIVFENLNIQNMMSNHSLALSIADASWGKLIQFCTYKAESAGKRVELVDPRGTSQECSRCGAVVRKSLSDRIHLCTNCGLLSDRDFNASLNILRRVGWGTAELENARRVEISTVSTRTQQASALKQEAHTL